MRYSLTTIQQAEKLKKVKCDVCISCSLFKMKNSYKNFSKYIRDFENWVNKIPKTAYIRMYVDESVLDDNNFIKLFDKYYEQLEIVLFEFPEFQVSSYTGEIFHDGTFGSIVRFLALYNKPQLNRNVKYVWTTDVDMPPYIFSYDNILDIKTNTVDMSFNSKSCNNREWVPNDVKYPILAGKIIVNIHNVKLNFHHFEKYLCEILEGKYEEIKNIIIKNRKKSSHYTPAEYFTYGFDELFLNTYINLEIQNYRKIIYLDIDLSDLKRYSSNLSKDYEKLNNLNYKIWTDKKEDKYKILQEILTLNKKIYESVKSNDKINDIYRYKVCLNDFNKYSDNINRNFKTIWSLSSKIIE